MLHLETLLPLFAHAGIAVFAISGALLGLRKELDIVGVCYVATLTGLAGETIRDLMLGATPAAWLVNPIDPALCIAAAVTLTLFNQALIGRRLTWLLYADAAGLAIFAVLNSALALKAGAHPFVAIVFGAMTATSGGVLRDLVCGEPPILFRKEVYVSAALLAASVFSVAHQFVGFDIAATLGLAAGLTLRLFAIWNDWSVPYPRYDKEE